MLTNKNLCKCLLGSLLSIIMVCTLLPSETYAASDPAYPVSVSYEGSELTGYIGQVWAEHLYDEGNKVTVTYSDNTQVNYICVGIREDDDMTYEYFPDGRITRTSDGDYNNINSRGDLYLEIDQEGLKEGSNTVPLVYTEYVELSGDNYKDFIVRTDVTVTTQGVAPKAEFIPADGFRVRANIGEEWIGEEEFYGNGNVIAFTFPDGSVQKYYYVKTKDSAGDIMEGFYPDGDTAAENKWIFLYTGDDLKIEEGVSDYQVICSTGIPEYEGNIVATFTQTVYGDKYNAEVMIRTYSYTGKKIKIKAPVVKDSLGRKIPAGEYTYTYKKGKKIGYYEIVVYFKNTNLYPATVEGGYIIGPEKPAIKSVKAGKGKAVVRWKKPGKKKLKRVRGYVIQYSTRKDFYGYKIDDEEAHNLYQDYAYNNSGAEPQDVHWQYVGKSKASKTVKGLTKGKRYYFRIAATYDDYYSLTSKVKSVVIK